jgi:multiple antibiotic resistance protein
MSIGLIAVLKVQLLLLSSSSSSPLSLPAFVIPPDFFGNLIKSTIALFVVIDPVGNVPLFIALTQKMEKNERNAVSKTAVITAAALLTVFAIAGSQILTIFGITINSFMVAGGILLFIVSIELLTYGVWRFGAEAGKKQEAAVGESGVVPLAFPLLAGPGAITSVMISFQSIKQR